VTWAGAVRDEFPAVIDDPGDSRPHRGPRTWTVVAATLAYIAALHYVYEFHIAPIFAYLQYAYRPPDTSHYVVAIALCVGIALVLPRQVTRPSQLVVWVLFVVAVVPSIVVPQIAPALSPDQSMILASWVAGSFLVPAALGTRQTVRGFAPRLRTRRGAFWIGVAAFAVVGDAYLLATAGSDLQLPSLDDVYGVRAEFATVEQNDELLSYLAPLLATVINPLLIVRGLWARRWAWLALGLAGQALLYSAAGDKTTVLSPVALLLVFVLFRASRRPPGAALLIGGAVLTAFMVVMDRLTATFDWTSFGVRRFLITPGLLTAGYVAVFFGLDKAQLGHSFLSTFFRYPYSVDPPYLVGGAFFGDPGTHANANLLADGYANFGYPGILMECLVLTVLLWIADDVTRGIPRGVAASLFVMPALSLANAGVFTVMLTHGLMALILLCACMPRTGWGRSGSALFRDRSPAPNRVTPNLAE
jgi:hypothetical protein